MRPFVRVAVMVVVGLLLVLSVSWSAFGEDAAGNDRLLQAAAGGDLAAVRDAVAAGADVSARDARFGATPLILAANSGHTEVVGFLLSNKADVNAKLREGGTTALWHAAWSGHAETVKVLLEHGADLAAKDPAGTTPLWVAAGLGHADVVRLLVEKNADIEARDAGTGATPLFIASQNGHAAVVQVLVDRKAAIDAPATTKMTQLEVTMAGTRLQPGETSHDVTGRTPLMAAAIQGHVDVVRLLLQRGADAGAKDGDGKTAAQLTTSDAIRKAITDAAAPKPPPR